MPGACYDYEDFFRRTRFISGVPDMDEEGRIRTVTGDMAIRYLDRVIVREDRYDVRFRAGITVEVSCADL